jgi:hypothetical protein
MTTGATDVDIVDALAIDLHESAARRQRSFNPALCWP